jgi:hypothetical protein
MAITSTFSIKGYLQGMGAGRIEIETPAKTSAAAVPGRVVIELSSGSNQIDVPNGGAGVTGVIITCPAASTRTKILKGAAADTGIQIATSGLGGTFVLLLSSVTRIFINCSGADTGVLTEFQFF